MCAVRAASSTNRISLILLVERSHDLEHASPGPEERAVSMILISLSLASKGTLNPRQTEPPLLLIYYCILVKANQRSIINAAFLLAELLLGYML